MIRHDTKFFHFVMFLANCHIMSPLGPRSRSTLMTDPIYKETGWKHSCMG
ncbi:Uncharacterised protein [Burkholderia cepacia]|nr:hypothetical protein DM41_1624 [Burkholderia cepacia ATCC 25416]SPV15453.1 Uncharacterised protein [Burkholderia cepacia]